MTVTYSFSPNTKIKSAEINQNFTDATTAIWSGGSRTDLKKEFGVATIAATAGAGAYNGVAVTFTNAFVTSVLVFMEVYNNDSSKVDNITHNVQSLTVNGFTPRIYVNTYVAPGAAVSLAWVAVGY